MIIKIGRMIPPNIIPIIMEARGAINIKSKVLSARKHNDIQLTPYGLVLLGVVVVIVSTYLTRSTNLLC
jgi:hypothetical protein